MLTLRNETPADIPGIHQIHVLAFGGRTGEAVLVDDLRSEGESVISMVAVVDGKIAGHILFSRLDASAPSLSLAPLAVHPDFQRQGIGSALIAAGLDSARQTGWSWVFVLGNPNYYTRFGFDLDVARSFSCPYSGNHFMAIHLGNGPADGSGPLTYPKAFKKLD